MAILFLGIFVTMVPVLMILRAGSAGAFKPVMEAVRIPVDYFWTTGALSAFLDNAPSYVVLFETAHATPMAEFAKRDRGDRWIRSIPSSSTCRAPC